MFKPNTNIIINSNKEIFIFDLTKEGSITYTIFDSALKSLSSHGLYDKNILKYSSLIDENDIIHLLGLTSEGNLIYYKNIGNEWSETSIAKFDMKSNIYHQIEILLIKGKLHIIYNYSNLTNSNIWTIQHVIYENEERHNAVRYISKKFPDPFTVDMDSQGNIHLLYRNNINFPQVYHSFYSPYTKSWSSLSKQISLDNSKTMLPFLFIDSNDNLHSLWSEEVNNSYYMKYLKMNARGKEKYIWKEIPLPYIQISKEPSIIYEEDHVLKMMFLSGTNISVLYSSDFGDSWSRENSFLELNENASLVRVRSNRGKINYIYCTPSDPINFYFLDFISFVKEENIPVPSSIESENKEIVEENIPPIVDNHLSIEILEDKIDSMINNYNSLYSLLNELLLNQKNIENKLAYKLNDIENKLDSIQKAIDVKKPSFFSRFLS